MFIPPYCFIGGPILTKCIDIVVLGFCGELRLERRKNLFTSKEEVPLLDDTGKTISIGTTIVISTAISLTGEHNQDSMSSSNMPVQV